MVPEFKQKTVRELIEGYYRIIYRIKNKTQIDILRIYHVARLLRRKSIR
jgi:toxin ParE1/3/4